MGTVALTEATFEQTIAENDIVLVDWWASWCGPCRMFAPVFDAAAAQHTDIVFAKIDTETEQALAGAAGIMSIPTLMAFREGVLIFAQPGALPAPALEDLIAQVRALDMEVVRGEMQRDRPEGTADTSQAHASHDEGAVVDRNAWDERYAGDELVWSAQPNRFLVAEVETLPPGRALDLACGEGRNAVWLAERGWDVTGVDFSNVGLDKARRLADGARRVGALGSRRRHGIHAGAREL